MQSISTHSSAQTVNSSCHPVHPARRLTLQSGSNQQNRSSINSAPPECRGLPQYSVFPALPQPGAVHRPQHFDPYSLSSQNPVNTRLPVFTYSNVAMNASINQPYQPYTVTGRDLLFGLQPSEYSYPRKLVYPYNSVSNPFERNSFLHDPRYTTQQQVTMGMPLTQLSQYVHPTQSPINPPIFYSPYGSSVSFTQSTLSIDVRPLNRRCQPSYRPRVFSASIPKEPSHNFGSGSFLSRGPPRKPKQSGFALWVGNLPGNVQIRELKDFFGMDELESILLIKKSNCAFVNYKTEASCDKALSLFNNQAFKNVRLVCRLRQSSNRSPPGPLTLESALNTAAPSQPTSPLKDVPSLDVKEELSISNPSHTRANPIHYFIMKSLTKNELAWSVANNVWTTQSHNERALNEAFTASKTVYLIFSVNKSGEFFGYAQMTSVIPAPLEAGISDGVSTENVGKRELASPQLIGPNITVTPRTDTAPCGKIFEDAVRGTTFWEVDNFSDDAEENNGGETNWGNIFRVEWIRWEYPLSFHRTQNLRNPWNGNREIKISRDGTEVEPSVGALILTEFDVIAASHASLVGIQEPAHSAVQSAIHH